MKFQSDDTGSIASEDDTQYGKASKFQDISDRAKAGLICEKDGMFLIICNCFLFKLTTSAPFLQICGDAQKDIRCSLEGVTSFTNRLRPGLMLM